MYIYSCDFFKYLTHPAPPPPPPPPPPPHLDIVEHVYNNIMHTSSIVMNTLYSCGIKTGFLRIFNVLFMNSELYKHYIEYTFTIL